MQREEAVIWYVSPRSCTFILSEYKPKLVSSHSNQSIDKLIIDQLEI